MIASPRPGCQSAARPDRWRDRGCRSHRASATAGSPTGHRPAGTTGRLDRFPALWYCSCVIENRRIDRLGLPLLYIGLGFASALVWSRIANLGVLPLWHSEILSGTAPAPSQYRLLVPWLAEALRRLLGTDYLPLPYFLLRGLATGLALWWFDRYLRHFFSRAAAAAGAMFLAAVIPFTYFKVVQESDPVNLLVFVGAFWALASGRDRPLVPLVLVGTLNRETALLVPAFFVLARLGTVPARRLLGWTALLVACWAAVYGGILAAYGFRRAYCDLIMLDRNFASWQPTLHLVLLFGAVWVLAYLGRNKGPVLLSRALWLLPPYLALHYVTALVIEVRLFLPFAPVVVPLAWLALFPETRLEESR